MRVFAAERVGYAEITLDKSITCVILLIYEEHHMAMGPYNGWSGHIRQARGNILYNLVRSGGLKMSPKCELCHNAKGLTIHSEEYGSTWEAMMSMSHHLCPTCHGLIHMRWKHRNRWLRHKQRIAGYGHCNTSQIVHFPSLGSFFGVIRGLGDLPGEFEDVPTGIKWVDDVPKTRWEGPPKVALIVDKEGVLRPDPKVYTNVTSLHGIRWDDHQLYEFKYGDPE